MRTTGTRLVAAGSLLATLLLGGGLRADADPPAEPAKPPLESVWGDKALGVSGITSFPGTSRSNLASPLLVVHDAKTKADPPATETTGPKPRASLAWWGGTGYVRTELAWPVGEPGAEVPNDLEAAAAIPDMPGHAILAESHGRLIHVFVHAQSGTWRLSVVTPEPPPLPLPQAGYAEQNGGVSPECEAFVLVRIDGRLVAVWGERGAKSAAGAVFFAPFDLEKGVKVDEQGAVSVRVPVPTGKDVRDVSDIAIDSEHRVFFAAADDEGDAGPFESAIYRLGTLRSSKAGLYLEREPEPVLLRRVANHKVEGLLVGWAGLFLMASDDENAGGWFSQEREAPAGPAPGAPTPR